MKMNGKGTMARAINANTEFPHPRPKFEYNGRPANGKKAPTSDLTTVFAAVTEAA